MDTIERIKARVVETPERCWEWTGAKQTDGYGVMKVAGRLRSVHRLTYELLVGPIPEGREIDHLCRNRACCNPAHLEAVTRSQNRRRGRQGFALTGRCQSGRHEITPENLKVNARMGWVQCRACHEEARKEWRARTKAAPYAKIPRNLRTAVGSASPRGHAELPLAPLRSTCSNPPHGAGPTGG